MKTIENFILSVVLLLISTAGMLFSQTSGDPIPGNPPTGPVIVGIRAVDYIASEPGNDTATLRVYRSGSLDFPLTISYTISGTASNGVDYNRLPGSITILAGAESALITITPIDDQIPEPAENVIITLNPANTYVFDVNSDGIMANRAYAIIQDNDSNHLPSIQIVRPTPGSIFELPTNIEITAETSDTDGFVRKVCFYANSNLLGCVETPSTTTQKIFTFNWLNPPGGNFKLTAIAYDNLQGQATSPPVEITITPPITNERTIVTIATIDGEAEEIPPVPPGMGMPQRFNPGIARVYRQGPTNIPIEVFYELGGPAENGVDYEKLPGSIIIPQGQLWADIVVAPIYDEIVEGTEEVTIRVVPPVCIAIYPPPPGCYIVGTPAEATIKIIDSNVHTNIPPFVTMISPQNGSIFTAPADIVISADARDTDGYVHTVEFFANNKRLCIITNFPQSARPINPFYYLWTNVPAGEYSLYAKATDDKGLTAISPTVNIRVKTQTNQLPIVTIEATDPEASELPAVLDAINPGKFVIRRMGSLDEPLTVYFRLSGSASNGVDYQKLPDAITIPAGRSYAELTVIPIDDELAEGTETVIATLILPEIIITIYPPPPPPYQIGQPSRATVYILDNETPQTNAPPVVRIASPRNGTTFIAPATIILLASAYDPYGRIERVEFFEGDRSIGVAQNPTNITSVYYPYSLKWSNVPVGEYKITAVATDNSGVSTKSEPIVIKVVPPITNTLPIVTVEAIDAVASEGPPLIIVYTNLQTSGANPEIVTNKISYFNPGVFRVHRSGPVTNELPVYYSLSGTASNGVDYLNLPGVVVIPEGEHSATITIAPIDDKLFEGSETVVLTLMLPPIIDPTQNPASGASNSDDALKPYHIGYPNRACVVIYDNEQPRVPIKLPDGYFQVTREVPPGTTYVIEVSNDLINWTPIMTNTVTDGIINFIDTESPDLKRRFYKIVPLQ